MNPFKTEHFLFYPRKAASLAGMETVVSEPSRIERAGPFCFIDMFHRWERIKEDELLQVPFEAWVVGRIASLTSAAPTDFVEFSFPFLILPMEIHDQAGKTVASVTLRASWQSTRWEGAAASISVGQAAMRELEAILSAEPMGLQAFELQVPGRDKLGWDGQSFLGVKRVQRPRQLIPTTRPEFRVRASSRRLGLPGEVKQRRFADSWPPLALLDHVPNWDILWDEEKMPLKPASNQAHIDRRMAYTTGDVYIADGRVVPCLIGLDEGGIVSVVVLEESPWEITCFDKDCDCAVVLTREQESMFPLRVISRLSQSTRDANRMMRFEITKAGKMRPWKFKG